MVTIRATAVNHTFGAINLEIVVHAYPDKLAPSLKQMAEYMIDLEKDGSENYSEATFTPLTLAGHDQVLAARYEHTSFDADRPYRHRLDLYALKACGTRRVCATYAQTLALNEVPAKAVLEMVLESVSYQPGRVVK